MKYTVLFSIVTTSLCTVSSQEDIIRPQPQKVKRTVEDLGYYAPPYFVNFPSQKDPYSDGVSFSGYRSHFSGPIEIPMSRSEMGSEEPSHSSEHLMFEGEEIDDEYPHSHLGDPSGDYKQKSAQVSHSEEQERVQTGYVYSDKPSYHPIVNGYANYCPQPAPPQPILPNDLPMLRPDLPYPVIRDRVITQKPKHFNPILENFKKIAEQAGLVVDYLSGFPTSFELLKKRLRERPSRPRTDRILMNVFQNEDPVGEFSIGSEELKGSYYRPRAKDVFSSFPPRRISDANPSYEREFNYGRLQNPAEYKYSSPRQLQSSGALKISEPYFRPYHVMDKSYEGSFPNFKASIL